MHMSETYLQICTVSVIFIYCGSCQATRFNSYSSEVKLSKITHSHCLKMLCFAYQPWDWWLHVRWAQFCTPFHKAYLPWTWRWLPLRLKSEHEMNSTQAPFLTLWLRLNGRWIFFWPADYSQLPDFLLFIQKCKEDLILNSHELC